MDIKEKALEIANKYYPKVKCAILTGSQIESEFVTPLSDVDIVLIDPIFSGITSDGVKIDGYKVDFTRVGYLNLLNILIDNSYSTNPIIVYMLKDGLILKDESGIAELAKKYSEKIFKEGNRNYNNEQRSLQINLSKLKKHLLKNLNNIYLSSC